LSARVLNLVQFACETGGTTDHDVESHIHAGLRSAPTTKTHKAFYERKLRELQAKRDDTRAAYDRAVASGEIVPPAKPTLEEIASGEGQAAEAARRLIAKRDAKQRRST
jgi:hypothetical protein